MGAKRYIVIHHSATSDNVLLRDFDAIKQAHLRRGYRDIGYHWVIERAGDGWQIIPGRPEWETGAHCPGKNADGIGVCCVGDFELSLPPNSLYVVLADLIRDIMNRHDIIEIGGHRDYYPTACPGRFFDLDRLRNLVGDEKVENVKIITSGKTIEGKLINGVTYAPLREIVNLYNRTIVWDEAKREVILK